MELELDWSEPKGKLKNRKHISSSMRNLDAMT